VDFRGGRARLDELAGVLHTTILGVNIFVRRVSFYAIKINMTKNLQSGVRRIVESAGIRWVVLAKMTGIRRARLSEWKNRKVKLTEAELRRVAGAVNDRLVELGEAGKLAPSLLRESASQPIVERGAALRLQRRQFGISQVALAKRAGFEQFELSMIETGMADRMTPEDIARLEKALTALIAEQARKLSRADSVLGILRGVEASEEELQQQDYPYRCITILWMGLSLLKRGEFPPAEIPGRIKELLSVACELREMRKHELSNYPPGAYERSELKHKFAEAMETIKNLSALCDVKTREALAHVEGRELADKISIPDVDNEEK
jgi:transcriptional regulator with XRE-family HTH domain